MSHKNVSKVLWYILVQLSSSNNTMSMVSGVRCQLSEDRDQAPACDELSSVLCFLFSVIRLLTPDTRNLTPVLLKKKIDKSDPYFVNNFWDTTLGLSLKIRIPDNF
jgi:hypothetical protein